ncbi:hypothetical protein Ae201684P_015093 [Aphanomyces euteiches]|nr:hypothetical protein Ae201684P_015093 [Aphanomyces euteiches]KAH9139334.1 hypothetical protein AeRB84_016357 [Aphanomyces euteiches]
MSGKLSLTTGASNTTSGDIRVSSGDAITSSGNIVLTPGSGSRVGDVIVSGGLTAATGGESRESLGGRITLISGRGRVSGDIQLSTASNASSGDVIVHTGAGSSKVGKIALVAGGESQRGTIALTSADTRVEASGTVDMTGDSVRIASTHGNVALKSESTGSVLIASGDIW